MKWLLLALHRYPSDDLVRLLLDDGANLVALDSWGNTVSHEASYHKRVAVVKVLLKYGANINVPSNLGHTPLHDPARRGGTRAAVARSRRGYEYTEQISLDRITPGSIQGVLLYCRFLTETWCRSAFQDRPGNDTLRLASERDYLQTMQLLSEWTGECVEDSEMRDQPRRCGFGRGRTAKLCGKRIYYPIASC